MFTIQDNERGAVTYMPTYLNVQHGQRFLYSSEGPTYIHEVNTSYSSYYASHYASKYNLAMSVKKNEARVPNIHGKAILSKPEVPSTMPGMVTISHLNSLS